MDNNSKCPLCGGKIVFDPASQKNLCKTCNSYFIINEYNNFDDFQKTKLNLNVRIVVHSLYFMRTHIQQNVNIAIANSVF